MKKAVLLSIRPKWAIAIDKGIKTVEIRKTLPQIDGYPWHPFKVYLYCTKGKDELIDIIRDGDDIYGDTYHGKPIFIKRKEEEWNHLEQYRQKVFGEFLCDKSEVLNNLFDWDDDGRTYHLPINGECCLTTEELWKYGQGKRLWGWHISKFKLYDKPIELSEFGLARPPQSWCYVTEK